MASSFLSFSLLFIAVCTADGFREYAVDRCVFNSSELSGIEYIYSHYYNKLEYTQVVLSKSVKPSIRLHSTMPPAGKHPTMLVCNVYDYPKH
ncbi:H-2 class II histocompatibility antigen, E-S beta chain-like protein [Lates japonicus]|uniref:H-2 class II histocompatibility antigen, E-S beta chain-like protein n=1 Tax=Lates japonicus TaxID=270547 RepID=A0AAD3NMP4_LATJO|nr:H-2 class II histocompatibility antigen, E-S beta chain-like protein [Lates japonicus]